MSQLPAYATNYGNTNSNQNANQPIAYSDSVVPPPTFQQNNYQANSGYPGSSQQGNNAYAPPLSVSTNPHSTLYPSQPGFQGQPSPQPNGTPYSPQQQYQGGAYQQNNQNSYTPPCNPQSQGGYPQQGGYSQQNPPGSFQQQPPSGYPTHQDNMTPQHGGFPQQTAPPGYQGPPPGNFNGDMQENSFHTQMGLTAAQSVPSHSYPGIAPPGQSGMPSPTHDGNPSIAASFFSQAPPLDPNKQANPYVIHWNKTVGIGAGLSEQGSTPSLKGFPTYEIPLYHVNDIFHGKIQPWNTKYAQAIKIFGPGMAAKLARATIRKQHDWLYRNVGRTNETGHITNGNDLLSLLNFGRLPNGYILFYTYVIVDGIWRFSQTGKSKMKDFMSKHAAHAGCAREVTYSGEFHIQQSPQTGGYKLILDNNSGTYAPDTNDLPRLAQLFRTNFPGLEVEALHFADPVLKGYVSMVNESNLRVH